MFKIISHTYFTNRFIVAMVVGAVLFVLAYVYPLLYPLVLFVFCLILGITLIEWLLLNWKRNGIAGNRSYVDKLSISDQNPIDISIQNNYVFPVALEIIDEVPIQFQYRDSSWHLSIDRNSKAHITYYLRPTKRGEYIFGALNIYVCANWGFVQRRYRFSQSSLASVYPSIIQMKKFEFAAMSNRISDYGIKKIRRIGNSLEFEQIKEYVRGDDPRTLNWKATARSNQLMVNNYMDEKSQPVYALIDKGRLMRFPFAGVSLLDYSINAALALSNIGLIKRDKMGLVTFSDRLSSMVGASKNSGQLKKILEVLYNQKTLFKESNFELLSGFVNRKIQQRSLLLLFTNFESMTSFKSHLPFLISLGRRHMLVVIFFKNKELEELASNQPKDTRGIYTQVIAEKYELDKEMVVKRLAQYGIQSILTHPENLTVETINKYLDIKARGGF